MKSETKGLPFENQRKEGENKMKNRMKKERPSWPEMGMEMAELMAKRSVCLRYQVGASFWIGNKPLVHGYNGPPKGIVHSTEVGCAKETGDHGGRCRGCHAEMNAVVNEAFRGISIAGATVFCSYRPCLECAKHLINLEIGKFVYKYDYEKEKEAISMLKAAGIELLKFDDYIKALGKG